MYSKLFGCIAACIASFLGCIAGFFGMCSGLFGVFHFVFLMAFLKGFVVVGQFSLFFDPQCWSNKNGENDPQQQSNAAENDEEGTDEEKHEEDEDDVEDK